MSKNDPEASSKNLDRLIYEVRCHKVMLDADLAKVYGVTTGNLNKAVKRNPDRFPTDFMFQLTKEETSNLMFQIGRSNGQHGGSRKPARVFTEHGAIMAANVLNSPRAVQMSMFVVRAFLKMRAVLSDTHELAHTLAALETELKERLNVHEAAIVTILQRVMDILDPPALPEPPQKDIGFHVKESKTRYRTRPAGTPQR